MKTAQTGAAVTAPGETADKTAAAFSLPGKPAASTAQVPPTTDPKAVAQTTRPGTAATVPAPSDASAQPAPNQHAAGTEQPPAQPLTRAVEEATAGAQVQAPAQAPASTRETHETAASIRSGQAETTSTQPVSAADGTAQQSGQQAPQSSPNHLAAVYTSQSQQTSSGAATPTNGAATQWQAPLRELAQTAQAVIRIAVRSRASNARITLKPAQLGSIEINLRYTSKGVSATLTGKSQAALSALTEAGADLRSALKQQGITLLSLDIHESAAEAPGTGPRQGDGDQLDKEAQTQNGTGAGDGDVADLEDAVQNSTRPTLGVVVDLFA